MEITTGLRHIRALQSQEAYLRDVFQQLHDWQNVSYHQFAAKRWFKLGLELIVLAAAMLIATQAIHSGTAGSSPASIALGLFILMRLNLRLSDFVTSCNACNTHMNAMSSSYTIIHRTAEEQCLETMTQPLPAVWPSQGDLLLQDVSAGYK